MLEVGGLEQPGLGRSRSGSAGGSGPSQSHSRVIPIEAVVVKQLEAVPSSPGTPDSTVSVGSFTSRRPDALDTGPQPASSGAHSNDRVENDTPKFLGHASDTLRKSFADFFETGMAAAAELTATVEQSPAALLEQDSDGSDEESGTTSTGAVVEIIADQAAVVSALGEEDAAAGAAAAARHNYDLQSAMAAQVRAWPKCPVARHPSEAPAPNDVGRCLKPLALFYFNVVVVCLLGGGGGRNGQP